MEIIPSKRITECPAGFVVEFLNNQFPWINHQGASYPNSSNLTVEELFRTLAFVENSSCVEDAINILEKKKTLRSSVSYNIETPGQRRLLSFEVRADRYRHAYNGNVYAYGENGDATLQLSIQMLSLKGHL